MESALHVSTTVLPGNRIEISSPGLKEGQSVDVLVFPAPSSPPRRRSALEIIEALQGHRLFQTVADVDAHLRVERGA
jgi:hypothetical protein